MHKQWKSILAGGAVAALLTLPAAADGWINGQTKSFAVHKLDVQDLVGNLNVAVRDGGPATVQVSGNQDRVNSLSVGADGDTLNIDGGDSNSIWDWKHWLDFSDYNSHSSQLQVHVTVPRGTTVIVENLVGDAHIGDTMAPIKFGAVSTNSTIGRVGEAHISLSGSGKVVVGDIAGDLHADLAGAGKIQTGHAQSVHADVAGSGSIEVASVDGGLHLDIAGSGDFTSAKVNGPTHVEIAGSGSVSIAKGEANPLHVDIMGSGNFTFGGTAVDPHVSALGSGNVKLEVDPRQSRQRRHGQCEGRRLKKYSLIFPDHQGKSGSGFSRRAASTRSLINRETLPSPVLPSIQ